MIADTGSVDTSASLNALVNGTPYRFRIAAMNASGSSQTSTPSQWVTPRTTPGQASEVSGQPGDQQVALTWTAPPSDGGAAISGYRIDQKAGNDSWSVAIPDTGNVMTATTVTGLGNGTDYQFRVAALNEAGAGPASAPSPSVTPRTFPDAANNVQAMAGNGQVQLSWLAPASDGGSPITGYRIEARAGDGSWTVAQASTDSTATIWVVTGLTNGVQYRFRVAAINVAGVGTFSTQTDPTTPVTTPSEPTNLFATPQDEQVALSWNAPGTTGGSPITGYRIEQKQGDSTWTVAVEDTGSVSPTASISGLTNGAEYRFRVSAVNAQGAGQPSTATPVVIPRTTPGTPSQLAGTPGDGYIDLVWIAPSSTGGSPITGYQVELKKGTDAWTVGIADTGSTQTSARVTSLINGQNYRFRVAALNAAGAGPPSTVTPAQIPRSTPGAPTTLRGLPGDETITLSWTEPNNTGGVGITGYRVEMRAGSASWDVLVDDTGSSATTWLATGLTNGIPHRFRVSARNEAGLGPASAATGDLLPLTTAGPPSAVNGVAQDRGVALTWIAPTSDGGSPIAGYRIEIKESGAEWRTAVNDTSSTTTTWLVSGLQNGRAYAFRVAALNSAGAGTVSAPSPEVTPKSADNAPTAPPVEPTPGSTDAPSTGKVATAITGWPSRAKPRSGKVRLTVQISPSEGRLAVIERRACNRKAGKLQCRWLQVGTQQLPASRDAVVRFTLRARQQIGRYRLVIPETGSAHAATTGVVKVRAVKK